MLVMKVRSRGILIMISVRARGAFVVMKIGGGVACWGC